MFIHSHQLWGPRDYLLLPPLLQLKQTLRRENIPLFIINYFAAVKARQNPLADVMLLISIWIDTYWLSTLQVLMAWPKPFGSPSRCYQLSLTFMNITPETLPEGQFPYKSYQTQVKKLIYLLLFEGKLHLSKKFHLTAACVYFWCAHGLVWAFYENCPSIMKWALGRFSYIS